jgi:uncharacterized membrane protein (UPF0127 family)
MRRVSLIILGLYSLLTSCKPDQEKEMRSRDWTFEPEATLHLINKNNDTIKSLQVELADTDYSIQLGMMYRDELTEDQGMLFVFKEATPRFFYMKNTDIPLDIIFVTTDKLVDSYSLNAQPKDETLLKSSGAAQYVLEVKSGMVEKWGLTEGTRLTWE